MTKTKRAKVGVDDNSGRIETIEVFETEKFRNPPMFIPIGTTHHDAEGHILFANKPALNILGKTLNELKGEKFSSFANWHHSQGENSLLDEQDPSQIAVKTGEIVSDSILTLDQPDAQDIVRLLVTAIPMVNPEETQSVSALCQIRDISKLPTPGVDTRLGLLQTLLHTLEPDMLPEPSIEVICQEILYILPSVFAYPEITQTRIRIHDMELDDIDFKVSETLIQADILKDQTVIGKVEIHYHGDQLPELMPSLEIADNSLLHTLVFWLGLVNQIIEKNKALEDLKGEALQAYDRTIEAWSAAVETQDKEASGHTQRVTDLALAMAKELGFEGEALVNIRRGALLHDIGKMSIPDEIMLKPGKLTKDEYQVVKKHPIFAQKWLSQIELLRPALQIPYYHHEKWDGSGYPQGLVGEDIPLVARMFAVVDVWDALISDRPYRRAMSYDDALDLILSESGTHFDPDIVEKFITVLSSEDQIDSTHELRIKAFGQARVWVVNRCVTSKDWQVSAAKNLFFLLLANSTGLTKEQVGLEMWPDVTTDELDIRFKNTLYRLRRAVGNDVILLIEGSYRVNKMLDYSYDVEDFETKINHAQTESDVDIKIQELEKAVRLYLGEYLPEYDGFWVITDRERYRQMYLESLVQLGRLYFEQDDLKNAQKYTSQALREDDVLEDAHRLAMRIHAKAGNRVEIIRQYESCCEAFEEKFNVAPSERTRELYEELIQT